MHDPEVEVLPGGACVVRVYGEDVSGRPAALPAGPRTAALAALVAHRSVLGDPDPGPGAWVRACFPALSAAATGVADLGWRLPDDAIAACRQPTWTAAVRTVAPRASRRLIRRAAELFGTDASNPCAPAVFPVIALLDALLGARPDRMVTVLDRDDLDLHAVAGCRLAVADAHRLAAVVGSADLDRAQRVAVRALRRPREWASVAAVIAELSPAALADLNGLQPGNLEALWDAADDAWCDEHRSVPLRRPALPPAGTTGTVLRAATTPWELTRWGEALSNCVWGGYARRLRGGREVVGAFAEGAEEPHVLVELLHGRITQLLGRGNAMPSIAEAADVLELLRRSDLLADEARARLVPEGALAPLLDLVETGLRVADHETCDAAARLLWCLGWLPDPDHDPRGALHVLWHSGPITPPRPLATPDEICLRFPDLEIRRQLLALLREEVIDPRQLVLAA